MVLAFKFSLNFQVTPQIRAGRNPELIKSVN
jgi:hypothetical protein